MKKFLALVLAVIMVFSVLHIIASAEDTVIPISECGGVISSKKTYSISTKEEFLLFEEMNKSFSGATIILTNDIIIHDGIFTIDENQKPLYNGTFVLPEPIDAIDVFKGTFDGQGYTISGLYVSNKDEYTGLVCGLDGTIKNLTIENSLFVGNNSMSVGSICGTGSAECTVEKCFSEAIVIGAETYDIGGIAGWFDGTMNDCCFGGKVIAPDGSSYAGGVVGMGFGYYDNCINTGEVYSSWGDIGGFVGWLGGNASGCANTGKVYGGYSAGSFAGNITGFCGGCFAAGEVYADRPSNFMSSFEGHPEIPYYPYPGYGSHYFNQINFYQNFKECYFIARYGDTADYYGYFENDYQRYLDSVTPDPYGMPQIVDDSGLWPIAEERLKSKTSWYYGYSDLVIDTGNENNGYPLPTSLQRRTVAPSITNVEYEKSSETRNTFNVTVEGRPAMIQFIEPTDGTRTYDRNHKNVTIKSYDAEGNEVNSLDRTAAYEVWSIYSNMMTNVEIRTRAKYLSDAIYTWDSETYDFPMLLANPIVSMKLSKVEGDKGAIPATVVTDDKTERVMFKMPNNTSVTVSTYTTDENGNRVFKDKAWMNEDGLNEIKVYIRRDNVWKLAGTLEYTVE